MSPRNVSHDLKARIPVLRYQHGLSVKEICRVLGIKKTLAYKTLEYYHIHGTIHPPPSHRIRGRRRILNSCDISFINALISQNHTIYTDEIQEQLLTRRGTRVSIMTLNRTLRRLCLTNKATSGGALEHNDELRAIYMQHIGDLVTDPNQLMFGDEASKDERTSARRKGWSPKGTRCLQRRFFVRGRRYSILPILTLDGIITHDIIEGSITTTKFIQFLKDQVLPLTNPYPGPRSVLVLDNCQIHHAEEIRALVEDDALCKLIFLPPYSPDYNPIEQAFSSIKAFLRRNWTDSSLSVMDRACQSITDDKALGYFKASGYTV